MVVNNKKKGKDLKKYLGIKLNLVHIEIVFILKAAI